MPLTVVDICNMALAHLRQRPVTGDATGILGDTVEATNCRRFYETAMRECFRAFDWQFARRYISPPLIAGADLPNWKYAYEYPSGIEAVRYIIKNDRTEGPVRFRVMRTPDGSTGQLAVYTNEPAAYIACTVYIEDPAEFPSDFIEFASLTLAAHLAMPITGKAELMMGMRKLAEEAGKRAAVTAAGSETDDDGESDAREAPLPTNTIPLEIANLALAFIGNEAIVSFGDRTKQANAVRRFYALALRSCLRSVDWPFARAYVQAAPSNAALIPGYFYSYAYPPNATAVRGFAKDYPTNYDVRFALANGAIYTRRPAGVLIYTRWDVDPAQYDPEFVKLLAHELAAMIEAPITGKNAAAAYLQATIKMLRDKARADAANEEPDELDERVPDWLAVRGIPSLTRQDREELMSGYGSRRLQIGPWGALPGSPGVNPTPPMITGPGPGSAILPAYIPGLTAPVEPPAPILANSNFWVESVGGRIERDGRLVIDDPSQHYVEPAYDVQEDN